MKDTWLKLHTSFLLSAKLTNLKNQKDCWAFVVIMALTKKGLITQEAGLTPSLYPLIRGLLKTNQRGLVSTIARLKLARLLDDNGYPIGFEESQLTPAAARKRKQRYRDKSQLSHDRGRKQRAESREREEEPSHIVASRKEEDYAKRLLKKHGIDSQGYLDNRGMLYWTSQMVDDVVVLYKDAVPAVGPRPADTFTDDPDLTTEDIEQGKAYLARLNKKET